jgi:fumarate reductase subunit D
VVLLYPVVSSIIVVIVLLFMVLYPFIRSNFNYHHGLYDALEQMIMEYIIVGITVLSWIIDL